MHLSFFATKYPLCILKKAKTAKESTLCPLSGELDGYSEQAIIMSYTVKEYRYQLVIDANGVEAD